MSKEVAVWPNRGIPEQLRGDPSHWEQMTCKKNQEIREGVENGTPPGASNASL